MSLRASPEHTRTQCASNRTAGIARIGSAVATGVLLTVFSLTSTEVQADKAQADLASKLIEQKITPCDFKSDAGPEMVIIAAGKFLQGSKADEIGYQSDEAPQHPVTISKPFAIGRCEVTVAEFALFVRETAYQTDAEKSKGCYGWNREMKKFKANANYNWNPRL